MLTKNSHRQLVVVHGLVLDRIQRIKSGVVTLETRCSPVSYGIICDKIYRPENHMGEAVRHDPRDNMTYAINQIEWLVLQVRTTSNRSSGSHDLCTIGKNSDTFSRHLGPPNTNHWTSQAIPAQDRARPRK